MTPVKIFGLVKMQISKCSSAPISRKRYDPKIDTLNMLCVWKYSFSMECKSETSFCVHSPEDSSIHLKFQTIFWWLNPDLMDIRLTSNQHLYFKSNNRWENRHEQRKTLKSQLAVGIGLKGSNHSCCRISLAM